MGLFLETAIVNCSDLSFLKQKLTEISKERPKLELKPDECRFVECGEKGIQLLLNENSVCYEEFAKALSEKVSSYVMHLYIYDEFLWGYFLYDKGREIDCFCPDPECLDEEENGDKYKGNAAAVAKYFGITEKSIEKYFVNMIDEPYNVRNVPAYENDKYTYANCWQMADFMDKLGFPYGW